MLHTSIFDTIARLEKLDPNSIDPERVYEIGAFPLILFIIAPLVLIAIGKLLEYRNKLPRDPWKPFGGTQHRDPAFQKLIEKVSAEAAELRAEAQKHDQADWDKFRRSQYSSYPLP